MPTKYIKRSAVEWHSLSQLDKLRWLFCPSEIIGSQFMPDMELYKLHVAYQKHQPMASGDTTAGWYLEFCKGCGALYRREVDTNEQLTVGNYRPCKIKFMYRPTLINQLYYAMRSGQEIPDTFWGRVLPNKLYAYLYRLSMTFEAIWMEEQDTNKATIIVTMATILLGAMIMLFEGVRPR